jgi:ABC-type lipoprotein export system ATPase subunit/GNAT superfamily N-acetyltransferase
MNIVRETPIIQTGRVSQIAGMFDLSLDKTSRVEWNLDITLPNEWNVGLVVGESGSGKTTVARELWGDYMCNGFEWDKAKSLVDGFPTDCGIKDITALLSSVGFSSPPNWLRPFHVLSNGEQFRVTIARALAEHKDLVVVDEFTSVVDRNVAQIGSAAVAKTVRARNQRLIAVTCHYDVATWLEPDWILDMSTGKLTVGRSLRRPDIELEIFRTNYPAWELFCKTHYLSGELNKSAVCFVALWNGVPVAFSSWLPLVSGTLSNAVREHRTVTLPSYQGVGIGNALSAYIASMWRGLGKRAFSTTSHPAMIRSRAKSPNWRVSRATSFAAKDGNSNIKHARNRLTTGFEYCGSAMNEKDAIALLGR